jgi:hypothetical protein
MRRGRAGTVARLRAAAPPGWAAERRAAARQPPSLTGYARAGRLAMVASTTALLVVTTPSAARAAPLLRWDHRTATTPTLVTGVASKAASGPSVVTMPLPAPPPAAPPDSCVKGNWPPQVSGAPLTFLLANGAYLWYDADGGWALRVTHWGLRDRAVFSGYLTTHSGEFVDVSVMSPVAPSPGPTGNDIVYETPNKRTVYFRFVGFGLLDGLNFATQCVRGFTVSIHIGLRPLPGAAVHLGSAGTSPPSNPFRLMRHPAGPVGGPRSVKPRAAVPD